MSDSPSVATVTQSEPGDRPILEGSVFTPAVLQDFERRALDYVDEADIKAGEQTRKVVRGIKSEAVRRWYDADKDAYNGMSLSSFMEELREQWLPVGWVQDLLTDIYGASQGDRPAREWANELIEKNATLPAASRLDNDSLRALLAARLHPDLIRMCIQRPPSLTADRIKPEGQAEVVPALNASRKRLTEWTSHIHVLDSERRQNAQELEAKVQAQVQAALRSKTRVGQPQGASASPQGVSNARIPSGQRSSGDRRAPQLTAAEEAIIRAHQGCLRCRKLYVKHRAAECKGQPPLAKDYQPLTEAKAQEWRAKAQRRAAAALALFDTPSPAEATPVAAAAESSSEYVPSDEPFMLPCLLASPATKESPVMPCQPLIDSGCDTVMIKPEFATALGLVRIPMLTPEPYQGFADGGREVSVKERTVFRLMSPDRSWRSRKVYAKVVPNLFTNVILGLPFLSRDQIIPDAHLRTLTSKRTGQDLLRFRFSDTPREPISIEKPSSKRPRQRTAKPLSQILKPTPKSTLWEAIQSRARNASRIPKPVTLPPGKAVTPDDSGSVSGWPTRVSQSPVANLGWETHSSQPKSSQVTQTSPQDWPTRVSQPESAPAAHHITASVLKTMEDLQETSILDNVHAELIAKYKDRFPDELPPVVHVPGGECHRIKLKNPALPMQARVYASPQKYREHWRTLIAEHTKAGRIRESSSPYAHPSFLIAKADPQATPRWVVDYRHLNANTIRDQTPLPRIDEILNDCANGRYFAKIDMTNAFFQTPMHPDDIKYTAVTTPFGLFEWTVMPMGLCNAPATQQRRMNQALRHLIGRVCHVYLDDIIIWSSSLDEHRKNVSQVMAALRKAGLFCSPKKTSLCKSEVSFLGHVISSEGVRPDPEKLSAIRDWPQPTRTKDVRAFLGLVRYIANFLPHLADQTAVLTPLTKKEYNSAFPTWTAEHQAAFDAIKEVALSSDWLATIQHDSPGNVYLTTDASDLGTGAMLSIGETWETSRPVAFDSKQFNAAQQNYPVHDKEMLAIVRATDKWDYHLIGRPFFIYTDHRTLEYFNTQKKLNRRQARWATHLANYDYELRYIKGESNVVADALSRLPSDSQGLGNARIPPRDTPNASPSVLGVGNVRRPPRNTPQASPSVLGVGNVRRPVQIPHYAAPALQINLERSLLDQIKAGYESDEFCQKLRANLDSMAGNGARIENGLFYKGDRLIIPNVPTVREALFQLAHDALGHFGTEKAYDALVDSYYWPRMKSQLEKAYIPGCEACQRNKSSTVKPPGPLHPLPVPDARFDSVAIDRVGPLPEEDGFNGILTMTDRLGAADLRLVPCRMDMSAQECARLFYDHWYCENGLPQDIVSDRDALFVSDFWRAFHQLTGVKLKMSTAFHPQTDGASERTNKTLNQLLRYVVDRQQRGWCKALPAIRFAIMNTVNASTGHTPFYLRSGHSPRLIPPLIASDAPERPEPSEAAQSARSSIRDMLAAVQTAKDALFEHKTRQAHFSNAHRGPEDVFKVGDQVMLSTSNRRREYKAGGSDRVAKLMPRSDGPFRVIRAYPERSVYTLQLPGQTQTFPGFHASQLKRFIPNDDALFPSRTLARPAAVEGDGDEQEWELEAILDRRPRGRGWQYRVQYKGYGGEDEQWRSRTELLALAPEMLAEFERQQGNGSP